MRTDYLIEARMAIEDRVTAIEAQLAAVAQARSAMNAEVDKLAALAAQLAAQVAKVKL